MEDSKVFWCKKSARRPVAQPTDARGLRGTTLHEFWDAEGHIFRCYIDHEGECEWDISTPVIIATKLKWA